MLLIFQEDSDKDSPLHNAVHGDNLAIAQLLIEKGAKVDVKNENGDTLGEAANGQQNGWTDSTT